MRVFTDTEFTDLYDPEPELISIGMVADDNREFYAECTDFDPSRCSNFVTLEVLPRLGAPDTTRLNRIALKRAALTWLATIPQPEIAVDYDGDWKLLRALLGSDVPARLTAINVWKDVAAGKIERFFLLNDVPQHHALYDARALHYALS